MYGIQTVAKSILFGSPFENDVKMYGIQTYNANIWQNGAFENDVKYTSEDILLFRDKNQK